MKRSLATFISLLKLTFQGWIKDNATVWAAALAYYTVFSLGPLLLITLSIAGLIFSKTSLENTISIQAQELLGADGAQLLLTVAHNAAQPTTNIIGMIVGMITLIFGASGVFGQLQQMLNAIWHVTQKPKSGIMPLIRSRLVNFTMVGVIAFLLLVSLIASTLIASLGTFFSQFLPVSPAILELFNFFFSFIILSGLFACILKILPDVKIKWKNVWLGAIITALLFDIGKTFIGMYIGHSSITSTYGSVASLIVLLLWVYYSTQILFFGVEFVKAFTIVSGDEIIPSKYAVLTDKSVNKKIKKNT
jgi:membrane protein